MADEAHLMNDFDAASHTGVVLIPTDDDSIRRRRRALAPIQVLTGIEQNKSMLDGDFWQDYDLFTLALSVIDQVALAMGISAGLSWEDTLDYARNQAARQKPDGGKSEWGAVAERVLVSLVTTGIEQVPYLALTVDGPIWREQRFRMLFLHSSGAEGTEHLRASEAAINIFVEALDLDIEAAQIANEAQLNALIARGAVASAVQLAQHANYRSIQYQEHIRGIVADTLIDPNTHDWIEEVPKLLDSALDHVVERLRSEADLLDAVEDRRDALVDPDSIGKANQLIEILRDCRHRHDELHWHLIGARSRLREALDDRFRRPPHHAHHYELGRDLLSPMMERNTLVADQAAERMTAKLGGLRLAWLPPLATLIDELCAPAPEPDPGEDYIEPEIPVADVPDWWEPYEAAVESMLDGLVDPVWLSQLLARAAETADRVYDDNGEPLEEALLAVALVHAAHRAWAEHLSGRYAGDRVLVAVDGGRHIDTPWVRCRDLLLVSGEITTDIARERPVAYSRTETS